MCGIAGIISNNYQLIESNAIQQMVNAQLHRGPDGVGYFTNENKTVTLGHNRLAIIDKSETAKQPMNYANRFTIVHNGELYNYIEIKAALTKQNFVFKTNSDTEVILAAYMHWGTNCLAHFDGMFAFAIWDEQNQELFIARDRFGEKPLYLYQTNDAIFFASEMKAFWQAGLAKTINHSMLCTYLGTGLTNIGLQPQITFYKSIEQFPAAHYAKISFDEKKQIQINVERYWDIDKQTKLKISENEAIEQLSHLLNHSVKTRLRSDVPIGTSLSGGLDSSSIAAILNKQHVTNYKTFSAIFPGFEYDETKYINEVVQKFSLSNTNVSPTSTDFEKDFNQLIATQEQPFISSSVYAQYKVMQLAKLNNTTVLLDGQGADETLGGYTKYIKWYLQELFLYDKKLFNQEIKYYNNQFGFKNKLAAWLPLVTANKLQKRTTNQLLFKSNLQANYIDSHFSKLFIHKPLVLTLNDSLYYNTMQMGLDELLRYADKNSMAHGVEVRLPFLQHDLVQFIFSLPTSFKIQQGFQKYILRKTMDNQLPNSVCWRKNKIGYETPQQQWMQSNFFIEKLEVSKAKLIKENIINKKLPSIISDDLKWRWVIAASYL
jgi:asparagine synthase (glutamine-hydrolysing)